MKKKLIITASSVLLLSLGALVGCQEDNSPYDKGISYAEYQNKEVDALKKEVLGAYDAKYKAAAAITDPARTKERFEAMAEAEYSLIYDEAIIVPWLTQSGYSASVARTVPWQAGRASYGLTGDKFKNVVVTNKQKSGSSVGAISKDERAKVTAAYQAEKAAYQAAVAGEDGFISLANKAPNPAVVDGKYTVGKGTANEITFDVKDEYKTTVTQDYVTMNYLVSQWTYNSFHFCNMVDGLVENDKFGNICGAIAESYKVEKNADGDQVYTFKLRQDAKWCDNKTGNVTANVTAADFVSSAKYVLTKENASTTATILFTIKNAAEFYAGEETDFAKVGVKAVDDYTLQYTLDGEVPYFLSSLTYAPFLPVRQAFLESKGTDFGNSENDIECNGAFRITEHTAGSSASFTYTKNENYYDKDHVYITTVKRQMVPGTATVDWARIKYEAGEIDGFSVSGRDEEGYAKYVLGDDPDNPGSYKNPANSECNGVLSVGDATYIGYFNINRGYFEVNEKKNRKTEDQKVATAFALANKDFRKGVLYGLDISKLLYIYQLNEWYNYLMRGYTNRELVSYDGRDYADFVDDVYNAKKGLTGNDKVTLTGINNADLHPATEANPTAPDPVYNIDVARECFKAAKESLINSGTLKAKDFPIKIDIIGEMSASTFQYQKEMFDAMSNDKEIKKIVKFVFNTPLTSDQDKDWGSISNNYDFSMWSGWGPDYADPNTFLHTYAMDDGDMLVNLGF